MMPADAQVVAALSTLIEPSASERVTFADFDREMGVFGDPDYCVERVRSLQREYGMDEFICYFNQGGLMDHAMVRQSMSLFAREVMPHCR